jgi:hypothetical protein
MRKEVSRFGNAKTNNGGDCQQVLLPRRVIEASCYYRLQRRKVSDGKYLRLASIVVTFYFMNSYSKGLYGGRLHIKRKNVQRSSGDPLGRCRKCSCGQGRETFGHVVPVVTDLKQQRR